MKQPLGAGAGLEKAVFESLANVEGAEDEMAVVTAIDEVVDRAGKLETKFASHAGNVSERRMADETGAVI